MPTSSIMESYHKRFSSDQRSRHDQAQRRATTPTAFQQLMQETAPNQGSSGYARDYLEEQGVIRRQTGNKRKRTGDDAFRAHYHLDSDSDMTKRFRPSSSSKETGHKRKHTGEDVVRDHYHLGSDKDNTERFKHSSLAKKKSSQYEPQANLPEHLQKQQAMFMAARAASVRQDQNGDGTPSKRRRIDEDSSPKTTSSTLKRPASLSSSTLSPDRSPPSGSAHASKSANHASSIRRENMSSPSKPKQPLFNSPRSTLANSGSADRARDTLSTKQAQTTTVRHQKKPSMSVERRKETTATTRKEEVNANGSRFTSTSNVRAPTIDQRIQHPPPDLESLNRLLQQVPGILNKLSKEQAGVIRDLAARVNAQEQRIEYLEGENGNLHEHVGGIRRGLEELMNSKFLKMEGRMIAQEKEVAALKSENERLQHRISGRKEASASPQQPAQNLTPRSDRASVTQEQENESREQEFNVFDEPAIAGDMPGGFEVQTTFQDAQDYRVEEYQGGNDVSDMFSVPDDDPFDFLNEPENLALTSTIDQGAMGAFDHSNMAAEFQQQGPWDGQEATGLLNRSSSVDEVQNYNYENGEEHFYAADEHTMTGQVDLTNSARPQDIDYTSMMLPRDEVNLTEADDLQSTGFGGQEEVELGGLPGLNEMGMNGTTGTNYIDLTSSPEADEVDLTGVEEVDLTDAVGTEEVGAEAMQSDLTGAEQADLTSLDDLDSTGLFVPE